MLAARWALLALVLAVTLVLTARWALLGGPITPPGGARAAAAATADGTTVMHGHVGKCHF